MQTQRNINTTQGTLTDGSEERERLERAVIDAAKVLNLAANQPVVASTWEQILLRLDGLGKATNALIEFEFENADH